NVEQIKGSDCFRAAVYEHQYLGNKSVDKPNDIIQKNLLVYKQVANKAKQYGSNILVFPEDGIIDPSYTRPIVSTFAERIPDPLKGVHNLCEKPDPLLPITVALSCLARDNGMYIVADYGDRQDCTIGTDKHCPTDGYYLYNTAVAFDPRGALVAKYHKRHLWSGGEHEYNTPVVTEFSYFDTPFGRIGLFICFDANFGDPGTGLVARYGVKTMAFPTYWFDELPVRTAKHIQQGWSVNNRANLLAATILVPETGSTGSGIYAGISGSLISTDLTDRQSKLLIADIPVDSDNTRSSCLLPNNRYNKTIIIGQTKVVGNYKSLHPKSIAGTSLAQLTAANDTLNLCNNGLCCQLTYSTSSVMAAQPSLANESYWFLVANWSASAQPTTFSIVGMCQEVCALIKCTDNTCATYATGSAQTVFKSIKLTADRFTTNYTYPSAMANDLSIVPNKYWTYDSQRKVGTKVSLSVTDFRQPLLGMSLFGRCFQRDLPFLVVDGN
ncbi:pantetheinase-like, partial [Oppia nitens]|uniref:pantetheinase-like n=1 Tax=Oppia nitens TaxID=1686743 RepID=UPI0023DB5E94